VTIFQLSTALKLFRFVSYRTSRACRQRSGLWKLLPVNKPASEPRASSGRVYTAVVTHSSVLQRCRLGASLDAHRIQSAFTCGQVKQYDMGACLQTLYVEAWSGGHVTTLDQSQASDIEPPILHYWRLFASAVCRSDGGLGGESTTFINTGDDAVPPLPPVSRLLLIRCPGNRQWNGSFIVSLNDEIISFARPQLSRLVFN